MKKLVIVDGFNFLFRSYFATAYTGRIMRNSKGFPTNALYAYNSMLTKLMEEEQADYMVVVMDKGKTFRHDFYPEYKAHRDEAPTELRQQIPLAMDLLDALGITYISYEGYEADDVAGSLCKKYKNELNITLVTSDQDYLQLIDDNVSVKLLKQKGAILFDEAQFVEEYGIKPMQIIDLKALEGDKSDNIPGVAGVGAKTALNLLTQFNSVEEIYENIEQVKGKVKDKLEQDREKAFISKHLAAIYCDLELEQPLESFVVERDEQLLLKLYNELEFTSLLNGLTRKVEEKLEYSLCTDFSVITPRSALYFDFFGGYYDGQLLGVSVYNESGAYYFTYETIVNNFEKFIGLEEMITYDYKRLLVYFKMKLGSCYLDFGLANYLLDQSFNEFSEIALAYDVELLCDEELYGKLSKYTYPDEEKLRHESIKKVKFMYEYSAKVLSDLSELEVSDLYFNIELPLSTVLADLELTGIKVDKNFLVEYGHELDGLISGIETEVYELAGEEFNISSYKQLGVILFEKLAIPYPKKVTSKSYSTSVDILEKIKDKHAIVDLVLKYRQLSKINGTYVKGLIPYIFDDGRIHTIFNQTKTATGRLSSVEPNLQNISVRSEMGKAIRKAFTASENQVLLSSDYSQIELRVLAHLSETDSLVTAFNNHIDIHTKTASDVFEIPIEDVTSNQRRIAKAVNFGIIYGQSEYGLSESLGIDIMDAKRFIADYFDKYAGIKRFLDTQVETAKELGYARTLFNRIRYIEELKSNSFMQIEFGKRLAMNTPIQGGAADIIKIAMVDIYRKFNELGLKSKMLLQIHDELVFDVVEEEKDVVLAIVEELMTTCVKLKVDLEVESNFGMNLYETK